MKGLLFKDTCTLTTEIRYFLLLVIITFLVRNNFLFSFLIVYATTLPVSSLFYDERAKWNTLANMLPFTPNQLIGSKYLLGFLFIAAAALCAVFCHCLTASEINASNIYTLLITACSALILESVQLPFLFGIGTEKGRLLFTLLTVFAACIIYAIPEIFASVSQFQMQVSLAYILLAALAAAILSNLLSFQISKSIYRRRI